MPRESLCKYFLHPPNLAGHQANLDAVGMGWGLCQDILDDTLGQFASSLIFLQDDADTQARFDIYTRGSIHGQDYKPKPNPLVCETAVQAGDSIFAIQLRNFAQKVMQ